MRAKGRWKTGDDRVIDTAIFIASIFSLVPGNVARLVSFRSIVRRTFFLIFGGSFSFNRSLS